jgi:hypothetical protein
MASPIRTLGSLQRGLTFRVEQRDEKTIVRVVSANANFYCAGGAFDAAV